MSAGLPSFVPEPSTLAAYALACLILYVTPGPDMSLALSRTLGQGRTAGLAVTVGATLGTAVHTLAAALGLSALIAASASAFAVLKVVGALYLAWLAFDALRHGSALSVRAEGGRRTSIARNVLLGLTVNLTNPKVVLFFVTFLPQFVNAHDPNAAGQLAFLGVMFIVGFSLPLGVLMVLAADRVVGLLRARPRLLRGLDYAFAGLFGAFAVRILTASSR